MGPSPLNSFFFPFWLSIRVCDQLLSSFSSAARKQIDLWIPGVSPSTKILLIFAFEHVVLGAKYLVHISTKAPKDKDADAALEREASSE